MLDALGTPYARMSQMRAGLRIRIDDDMLCESEDGKRQEKAGIRIVHGEPGNYWFQCCAGEHNLEGQLREEEGKGDYLVGVYNV